MDFCIRMKVKFTAVSKIIRARFYMYKKQKHSKTFLYAKIQTLWENQDNYHYIFIYKKLDTLCYSKFHENFEIGVYIQKAWHFALRAVFIYKNPSFLQEKNIYTRKENFPFYIKNIFYLRPNIEISLEIPREISRHRTGDQRLPQQSKCILTSINSTLTTDK